MAVAYIFPLAILMPAFAFYEMVRASSECTDLEIGNYQNKYYSYQPEFKYVPCSHSSAFCNEHCFKTAYSISVWTPFNCRKNDYMHFQGQDFAWSKQIQHSCIIIQEKSKAYSYATAWRAFLEQLAAHIFSSEIQPELQPEVWAQVALKGMWLVWCLS